MEATIPKVHIFMKYKIHSLNLNCLLQTAMHGLMVALKRARNVASKPSFIRRKKLNFFTRVFDARYYSAFPSPISLQGKAFPISTLPPNFFIYTSEAHV